jgi:predicted phosphodiesterase
MGNPGRYAVLSDVHANAEALRAVLDDIRRKRISEIFFLGDAVGYGPDPNECVELLYPRCPLLIAGNHDWAVLGRTGTETFNENARLAVAWTKQNLSLSNTKILEAAPLKAQLAGRNITLVHAAPFKPELWKYILTKSDAEMNFEHFDTDLCFTGHSHRAGIIEIDCSGGLHMHKEEASIKKGHRFIINVGSVGQPRDGDPRACYAVSDDGGIGFVRVEYDIAATQEKMRSAGLPEPLIERLSYGM